VLGGTLGNRTAAHLQLIEAATAQPDVMRTGQGILLITVARSYLRVSSSSSSESDLTDYGSVAYEAAEAAGQNIFSSDDRGTRVEVWPGSIQAAAWIVGSSAALVLAIGNYGAFWDGLATIREHARVAAKFIERRLRSKASEDGNRVLSTRVTTRQLTALERLHRQVTEKRLSPDEAASKALRILRAGDEGADPQLIRAIEHAFGAKELGEKRLEADTEVVSLAHRVKDELLVETAPKERRQLRPRKLVIERAVGSSRVVRRFE